MSTTRTTVRTVERGVRVTSKSQSSRERNNSSSRKSSRSGSPMELAVKQQMQAFVDHSQMEKSEMTKLNERLGVFVNRVKTLECENTKLMRDINDIQNHWGEGTRQVRDTYEQNLFDMRTRIDDVANLKTIADVRNKRAQYETSELQKRFDDTIKLNDSDKNKIKCLERELCQLCESGEHLRKSCEDEKKDIEKYRKNRDEVWSNLVDLLDKLDDELYRRISTEYSNQTLREHIEFIKQINERELLEMSQLGEALPFNDQIEFYKDQLKRVISNIRKDYEQLHLEQTREMEEWMRQKTEELAARARERDPVHDLEMGIQLENIEQLRETYEANLKEMEELRRQQDCLSRRLQGLEEHLEAERANINQTMEEQNDKIKKLKDLIDQLLADYNLISTNKATLEYEMQVYKRLLDSQLGPNGTCCEKREKIVIDNQTLITSNAFGGKVQNKKEKKGSIGISDSSPDGKFIIIENIGSNSTQIDLSNWVIKRKVDGNEIVFKIPQGITLPPNKEITIWANSYKNQRGSCDLVADFENWGIGINSVSRLVSSSGEEKSSFCQQITFSNRY
jgi:intermediate filament protein if